MSDFYSVTLDKGDTNAKLGLDVLHSAKGEALPISRVDGGPAEKWNIEHPDQRIEAEDRIVEVNGIRGDVSLLLKACTDGRVLKLSLMRKRLFQGESASSGPPVAG